MIINGIGAALGPLGVVLLTIIRVFFGLIIFIIGLAITITPITALAAYFNLIPFADMYYFERQQIPMDWLTENQIDFQFHNYKKQGITLEILTTWLAFTSWEKLLNRAGTTYKKLSDEEKASITDASSAMEWLIKQNSMIKRPILEANGKLLVGFDEQAYQELFA